MSFRTLEQEDSDEDSSGPTPRRDPIEELVALIMTAVGALSAIGPAVEGLRIQPTEALREE